MLDDVLSGWATGAAAEICRPLLLRDRRAAAPRLPTSRSADHWTATNHPTTLYTIYNFFCSFYIFIFSVRITEMIFLCARWAPVKGLIIVRFHMMTVARRPWARAARGDARSARAAVPLVSLQL